jgi:signal transduction histidine kinase
MKSTKTRPLGDWVADRIAAEAEPLTREWLDALDRRLPENPGRIFPTALLLDHIPEVLVALSRALRDDGRADFDRDVRHPLEQLARLRRVQGYDVDEILEEFELLGEILFSAVERNLPDDLDRDDAGLGVRVCGRLYRALLSMTTITARAFRASELEERRERAKLLGHHGEALGRELNRRLDEADRSVERRPEPSPEDLLRSLHGMRHVADEILTMAILQASEESARGRRRSFQSLLADVLAELSRLLEGRHIEIELVEPLPDVPVDAARAEMVLLQVLGRAIKTADPGKRRRFIRIAAERLESEDGFLVRVTDNGLGLGTNRLRAVLDPNRGRPSRGLGTCRTAVEQLGGKIWIESTPGRETTVFFTLPSPPDRGRM